MTNFKDKTQLIWSIADILRGGWKQHEYQDVILPLVVIKRLDLLLSSTKKSVLEQYNELSGEINDLDPILKATSGVGFYNISEYDFESLLEDPAGIAQNFRNYLNKFSENITDIIEKFDFDRQLDRLDGGNLLYEIIKVINKVDLHPDRVDNHEMGSIFEELIRKFAEQSNETAGEHYTPRDVIKVMVEVLFAPDQKKLQKEHLIKTVYDCACGTGGMLSVAKDHIKDEIKSDADIYLYGQELNPVTYAMCKADMLIKGEDPNNIKGGEKDHSLASTLANDQFFGKDFDYMLTNPPFGVDWKKDKQTVEREAERGFAGRFGAGTPRVSDGQLLFLQHLISKMRPEHDGGSRLGIVFNGSPLFTGDAGSGESEIRRWILENDWLETIIALPDQLFFNTGIPTYLWFITNRKSDERKGKVQIVDARGFCKKIRKSLGNKRNEITEDDRKKIIELYSSFEENEHSKIFNNEDFGYRQITVERPLRLNFQVNEERLKNLTLDKFLTTGEKKATKLQLQRAAICRILTNAVLPKMSKKLYKNRQEFISDLTDTYNSIGDLDTPLPQPILKAVIESLSEQDDTADICMDSKGNSEAHASLRDTENIPLDQNIQEYFNKEVKPYVTDAWINESKKDHKDKKIGKVGYEIPVTRFFYKYNTPRSLKDIEIDIQKTEQELVDLLKQMSV